MAFKSIYEVVLRLEFPSNEVDDGLDDDSEDGVDEAESLAELDEAEYENVTVIVPCAEALSLVAFAARLEESKAAIIKQLGYDEEDVTSAVVIRIEDVSDTNIALLPESKAV